MRKIALYMSGAGVALIALSMLPYKHGYRVFYPLSPSLPVGLYLAENTARGLTANDIIVFELPKIVTDSVKNRPWFTEAPFMKRIAAGPGNHVCIDKHGLFIDGKPAGKVKTTDSGGKTLPQAEICRKLSSGEYWTISDHENSFDSRYFGAVNEQWISSKVIGKITWNDAQAIYE